MLFAQATYLVFETHTDMVYFAHDFERTCSAHDAERICSAQ
jgi:hypothetical protein